MSRELRFRAVIPESNAVIFFGLNDLLENKFSNRELLWPWLAAKNVPDQFTGLKDKNGVEICESDRVSFFGYSNWIVAWHGDGWKLRQGADEIYKAVPAGTEMIVFGNIHEHPELLEAK